MELARTTGEEKESLALKLIAAENQLSMLRMRLMRNEEERTQQQSTIGAQTEEISRLLADKESLTLRRDQLVAENYTMGEQLKRTKTELLSLLQQAEDLKQTIDTTRQKLQIAQQELQLTQQELDSSKRQLDTSREEITALRADQDSLETQLASNQQQLSSLQERYSRQSAELQLAKVAERQSGRELTSLRSDYKELKIKYDKLVRPARSPEGRYVVEVRYTKVAGRYVIEFKTEDESAYRKISRDQLERDLSGLKAQMNNGLYVKVIIPEGSSLSFNEAWTFTSELLDRYDYYSQDDGPELIPLPTESEPVK
jgi:chromosome segregation ATPase